MIEDRGFLLKSREEKDVPTMRARERTDGRCRDSQDRDRQVCRGQAAGDPPTGTYLTLGTPFDTPSVSDFGLLFFKLRFPVGPEVAEFSSALPMSGFKR